MRHDRAGADDGAGADRHSGQEHRARANVRATLDADRLDQQVGLDDRHVGRYAGVLRAEDLRPWAPADVVLQHQVARVEVRLGPDPHVIADAARPVEATLEVGPGPDEHAIANRERLDVLEANPGADTDAVPERPAGGTPDRTPHEPIELSVADGVPRVQVDQLRPAVLVAQPLRQADLEIGISRRRGYAMHRGDQATH